MLNELNGVNHNNEKEVPIKKIRVEDDEQFDENDKYYYKSYESLDSHYTMLTDSVRTLAYKKSIDNMKNELNGATIIDVGSGTGILSLFCANAGAKKVYALEANIIANLSREFIRENKKDNIIEVIQTVAEEAKLKVDKVDAIVSEWMGYCLVCENMLSSVLQVRDKYLKKNGLMFPCSAQLLIAGAMNDDYNDEREYHTFSGLSHDYGVKMTGCLFNAMVKSLVDNAVVASLAPHFMVTREEKVLDIDLYTAKSDDVNYLNGGFELHPLGETYMSHLVLWFTTEFPDGSVLSTSPSTEQTHWMQTLIKLPENLELTTNTVIKGNIKFAPSNSDKRRVSISVDLEMFNQSMNSKSPIKKMHFESFL